MANMAWEALAPTYLPLSPPALSTPATLAPLDLFNLAGMHPPRGLWLAFPSAGTPLPSHSARMTMRFAALLISPEKFSWSFNTKSCASSLPDLLPCLIFLHRTAFKRIKHIYFIFCYFHSLEWKHREDRDFVCFVHCCMTSAWYVIGAQKHSLDVNELVFLF